jgi:hypothetical protein
VNATLRRAGTGDLTDGGTVIWSGAEGRRGRRWRWMVLDRGVLRHAGLIELAPVGRLSRLELDSRNGLLTLHPEPDGRSIQGNVVTAEGVRPLAFRWHVGAGIELAGDAFATALLPAGDGDGTLLVRASLGVFAGTGSTRLSLDERGVPRLTRAREWPLQD